MLWLPRWLRDDTPPTREDGVSRRTFLFLGASTAVGALIHQPAAYTTVMDDAFIGPRYHGLNRALYGRLTITGPQMQAFLGGRRGGKSAWFAALVRAETEAALADARREAWRAGFTVADTPAIMPAHKEE